MQNKYLLGRVLGHGGFGITYLAWDKSLNLKLAIKEYLPQQLVYRSDGEKSISYFNKSLSEEFNYGLSKFLEEARTLARFNEHPNIVTIRDYFEANKTAYLIMNYHQGITMQAFLQRQGGKIAFTQAVKLFMPVLDALKEVHSYGILHRDISPDNILISEKGQVILIDFGAARQAVTAHSRSMSVIMKAGYSPPEQYQSRGKQGPWTDLYAVAATMYRSITGQAPLEAVDRMAADDLISPSQLGVTIEPTQEAVLLKAMAVKAEDRYQSVEEFQGDLIAPPATSQAREVYSAAKPKEPEKKPELVEEPEDRAPKASPSYTISKKSFKTAALVAICGLLLFVGISLFGDREQAADPAAPEIVDLNEEGAVEETGQAFDRAVIADLDADYYIDYTGGTIPLFELPIGARVVDPSWEWEFRTGRSYTLEEGDETKPVNWLVVAKDHYGGIAPHVTLLSEELIGQFPFDDSSHLTEWGYNHWGESGSNASADRGLRPWLNSTGIHSGEGFSSAFSEDFKQAMLTTTLPNTEWEDGSAYSTIDNVFIPSTTELGDTRHYRTYPVGEAYAYFQGADSAKRAARLGGDIRWYWTRSPGSLRDRFVRHVYSVGAFNSYRASADSFGVRPALNLKSEVLVSEIPD